MKIMSPMDCGFAPHGKHLFNKGENEFVFRDLHDTQQAFVIEMIKANIFTKLADDEPAVVIDLEKHRARKAAAAETPEPSESTVVLKPRMKKRKKKAAHG